jgi:UDP-N-acetylglucosamine diphosphorylase / glucose-1-phosphate thymidylyltransferase / UDP-N-acetylgalactosamine diphosphorylase / glucosamine-1-phosphate N-acetyltransferase / galactosamine-1-phosphate N-acetyltransferase
VNTFSATAVMRTPFNEEARALRIQNKPLWLHHPDTLAPYTTQEVEFDSFDQLPRQAVECLVHRDNLYFDQEYIDASMAAAQKLGRSCRAAFAPDITPSWPIAFWA